MSFGAPERPEGEDHREGPPGYDLDEQAAYRELAEEQAGEEEVAADAEESPPREDAPPPATDQ